MSGPNRASGRERARTASVAIAAVAAGAVTVLALGTWVVEPVTVGSDSMEPTVRSGDVVVVNRLASEFGGSLVGRVISFRGPLGDRTLIKRVVAEAGQTLAIRDGKLYVDGHVVNEPYVAYAETDGTFFHRVAVPADHVFVLGDNRAASVDSRDFGFVPLDSITGSALWVG